MNIRILTLAIEDLDRGRNFYERQQRGLGDYFLDALFSDIDSLLLHAGVHQKIFGYFRALSDRFPYAIYYRVDGGEICVWRILDCRQNPDHIERGLTEHHADDKPAPPDQ